MTEAPENLAEPIAVQPIQLSYVSLAGEEVPPATRENAHLLQHAADYQTAVRNLRFSGIGDIVWGLLNCGIAVLLFRYNLLNTGVLLLGTGLIAVGVWIIAWPSPIGMLIDGVMLLLMAAWNIMIDAWRLSFGYYVISPFGIAIIAGLIFCGVRRIRRHSRFAVAVTMQPSGATVKWLGGLVKAIRKAKPQKDATAIQFVRNGWFGHERWKARLLPEVGVFVSTAGDFAGWRDVSLATPDAVEVISEKKQVLFRKYRVQLGLKGKVIKVVMPEVSLQRLHQWLTPPSEVGDFPMGREL